MSNLMKIIELDSFDTAFAVSPGEEEAARRRFMTLFATEGDPGCAGSLGTVHKVRNAQGEVFAMKQLNLTVDEAATLKASQTGEEFSPSAAETMRLVRGRMAAFQEEYRIQLAFSHLKGFPRLYGMGVSHGQPLIIMEWVEGQTLSDAHAQLPPAPNAAGNNTANALPAVDRLTIARLGVALFSALAGVENLRERPAHRDLSPGNIMLRTSRESIAQQCQSGNFDLCLIDFGSATFTDSQSASFTMVSDIWRNGTPEYAPPEMLTCDIANVEQLRQSPSIDVYAACSVLYELFSGHTPFRVAENRESSPYRLKVDTAALPLACYTPAEQQLATIIMSGLAPVQADRPRAKDLVERLQTWCAQATGQPAAPAAAATPAPTTTPRHQGTHLDARSKTSGGIRVGSTTAPSTPGPDAALRGPAGNTQPTTPWGKRASERPAVPLAVRNNQLRRRRVIVGSVAVLAALALLAAAAAAFLL